MKQSETLFRLADIEFVSESHVVISAISACVSYAPTDAGMSVSVSGWNTLAIGERMVIVSEVIQCALSLPGLVSLRWAFSGVLLDRDEAEKALIRWGQLDIPVLSFIDLVQHHDRVRTFGLDAIAGRDVLILCHPGYTRSAMVFAMHAARHLLTNAQFASGQYVWAGGLRGVVLDRDNVGPETIRFALVTAPNPDRTSIAN